MNTQQEKAKVQKITIGYLIAMVVIFLFVLFIVKTPGVRIVLLIATVLIFSTLIVQLWAKRAKNLVQSSEEANKGGSDISEGAPKERTMPVSDVSPKDQAASVGEKETVVVSEEKAVPEVKKPEATVEEPKMPTAEPNTTAAKPKTTAAKPKTTAAKPKTTAAKPKTTAAKKKVESEGNES